MSDLKYCLNCTLKHFNISDALFGNFCIKRKLSSPYPCLFMRYVVTLLKFIVDECDRVLIGPMMTIRWMMHSCRKPPPNSHNLKLRVVTDILLY